jgi:hypothetical protein
VEQGFVNRRKMEKVVVPDVQSGFDLLFPEHQGHMVDKVVAVRDLSLPFRCSCGEELKVTLVNTMCNQNNAFLGYLKALSDDWSIEYNVIRDAAYKLGYCLLPWTFLEKLIKDGNIKEGESL